VLQIALCNRKFDFKFYLPFNIIYLKRNSELVLVDRIIDAALGWNIGIVVIQTLGKATLRELVLLLVFKTPKFKSCNFSFHSLLGTFFDKTHLQG